MVAIAKGSTIVETVHLETLLGKKLLAVKQLDEVEGLLGIGRIGVDGGVKSHRGSDASIPVGHREEGIFCILTGKSQQTIHANAGTRLVYQRGLGIRLVLQIHQRVRLLHRLLHGLPGD